MCSLVNYTLLPHAKFYYAKKQFDILSYVETHCFQYCGPFQALQKLGLFVHGSM